MTKVTLILSSLGQGGQGGGVELGANPTPAMHFITLIKMIESMSRWGEQVMDRWVTCCLTRQQLKQGVDVSHLITSQGETGNMCQALALWNIKQAKEMRFTLTNLLYHYITIEDNVLEATGSVSVVHKRPSYHSLFV